MVILYSILIFISSIIITLSADTEIVWIDPKVNNNENKSYQDKFRQFKFVKLSCFVNISEGINYLKSIEFSETFIITSGRAYPEFIDLFKKNINELMICPKTIIFTRNKNNFINILKNKELSINHPFYNAGSVQDTFSPVHKFLSNKKDIKLTPINNQPDSFTQELNFE